MSKIEQSYGVFTLVTDDNYPDTIQCTRASDGSVEVIVAEKFPGPSVGVKLSDKDREALVAWLDERPQSS